MIRTQWRRHSPRPVAVIRLDRPDKKNALTPAMLDDLSAALAEADQSAAAIVLAGSGSAFCAGFDLSLCKDNSDALAALLRGLADVIGLMRELTAPVIIAAHGAAIAGGCALLAGADVVVTHAACKLGYPVVRLGISPAVNAPMLADAIGAGKVREKLLGGQVFTGREAAAIGLAHAMAASAEQVIDDAIAIADDIAAKPSVGVAATKRWMRELDTLGSSLGAGRGKAALAASLALVGSPEERARLSALWS